MSTLPLPVRMLEVAAGLTELGIVWLVQSTLILAAGLAAGWLIARRGPALQSALYRTTLVAIAACPLVAWLLSSAGAVTGLSLPTLNVVTRANESPSKTDVSAVDESSMAVVERTPNQTTDIGTSIEHDTEPVDRHVATVSSDGAAGFETPVSIGENVPPVTPVEFTTPSATDARTEPGWEIRTRPALFVVATSLVWFSVSLVLLARLVIRIRHMVSLCREATPAEPEEQALCEQLAASLGVPPPRLLSTPFLDSPCLAGTFRPVILLPEEPLRLSLSAVLTHELAHLKRGDHRWNLAAQTMLAILFFQPLLRWLVRRLEIAAEEVCDDHVVNLGVDRTRYADGLVALAEQSTRSLVSIGVPLVTLRSLLARRVQRILDHRGRPSLNIDRPAICAVLFVGLLVTALGGLVSPNGDASTSAAVASADDDDSANTKQNAAPKPRNGIENNAQSSTTTNPPEKAADDDPLPRGATARLGTTRFRPGRTIDGVEGVSFLPDNKTLALTTFEGWLEHWDAESGRFLREMKIAEPYSSKASHTPDGRFIAARGWDSERRKPEQWVALVEAETGRERMRLDIDGHGRYLAISADGSTVVADGEKLRVIDVEQKAFRHQLDRQHVESLALSADGELLLIGSPGNIKLWNLATGEAPRTITIAGRDPRSKPSIEAIAFSPDGSRAAVGNHQTGVSLVDLLRGKVIQHFSLDGPESWRSHHVVFSPDGRMVATPIEEYYGGGVAIWEIGSGAFLKRLESGGRSVKRLAFSQDGRLITGTSFEPILCVWNVETGERFGRSLQGHTDPPSVLRFLPSDERLASASDDGTVHLWNLNSSKLNRIMTHEPDSKGHTRMIRGMDVSPDGKYIASSCLDNTVRVWESDTGRELHRVEGHGRLGGQRSVRFTPESKRLVSWGDDMRLHIVELDTGKGTTEPLRPSGVNDPEDAADLRSGDIGPVGDRFHLESGMFSPDASRLVLLLKAAHVFDVKTRQEVLKFEKSPGHSLQIAISGDNRYLLTLSWTQGKKLHDADAYQLELRTLGDGKVIKEINLPHSRFGIVAFSHDSRRAAIVAGRDSNSKILLLSIPELKEIGRINGLRGNPRTVEFSHSGKQLAVSNADTSIVLYDLEKHPAGVQSRAPATR